MIYNVEAALGLEQSEDDWQRWYADMKPPQSLLSVPGMRSAQRFKGVTHKPYAYAAIYSVDSPDVLTSEAYRNIGGGNFLTNRWKPLLSLWTRNLFDGADAPDVADGSLLGILDGAEPSALPPDINGKWLPCVALEKTTPYRIFAVLAQDASDRYVKLGFRLFRPLGAYHTPQQG